MRKSPISAVVVSRNEGNLLGDCLQSLLFCDEIIVFDLESVDDTTDLAKKSGATVIHHKVVPVVEEIRVEAAPICKHDWILFLDPDERISPALSQQLDGFVLTNSKNVGIVTAPWIFYFKRKRLKGTMWGTKRFRHVLYYRPGITLHGDVHLGTKLKPGYEELSVGDFENANITHFWSDSLRSLISKHRRYVKKEGEARNNNGESYPGVRKHFRYALNGFYSSYFIHKGYKDGFYGLLLSMLFSWYTFASLESLRKFQKAQS